MEAWSEPVDGMDLSGDKRQLSGKERVSNITPYFADFHKLFLNFCKLITLLSGGLRVPAFITGKGVKQGQYSNIMHITDIQMTILDMIGHKRTGTKPVDGVSHWDEFRAGKSHRRLLKRLKFAEEPRSEILERIHL